MAITKRKEMGSIEILPDGCIQCREDTILEEDGVEISRTYHPHVVEPRIVQGDLDKQDQRVKDVCAVVHTKDCKDSYIAKMEKLKADYKE